jgi:hypothetical protein
MCGLILLATLGACSETTHNAPTVHRPGPASTGYYGTRTPGDLAFGGPTGLRAPTQPIDSIELDRYLKQPAARAPQASKLARANVHKPGAARLALLPARDVAPVATPQAPSAVPAPAAPSAPMAAAPTGDAQRYAAREVQSSKQAQYRGGDVVVISVSTILIVLLIVLLILLLR